MMPSRFSRDTLFIVVLILLLAALTVGAALLETRPTRQITLDSDSYAPDGARALFLWLESVGFNVQNEVGAGFAIPEGVAAAFILEPVLTSQITDADIDHIDAWVRDGGLLIFASENPGLSPIAKHFGFQSFYLNQPAENLPPMMPLFSNPPLTDSIPINTNSTLDSDLEDFLPLAAIDEGPIIVSTAVGEGVVILSTDSYIFKNEGLKSIGSGAFLLNLLDRLPEGANIWFDEWHHGKRQVIEQTGGGPTAWLRGTPAGRAILYSAGAVFIWIVLSGRAFGRPIAMQQQKKRRIPIEYVNAIANLNQRAGNRENLLAHYHQQYKRRLGLRFRIDSGLSDEQFLVHLHRISPEVDVDAIAQTLKNLSDPNISENELIQHISESIEQNVNRENIP